MNTDYKPGAAFSNGTDWEFFQENNCYGAPGKPACARDADDDCPLIMLGLTERTPDAWTRKDGWTQCSEYQTPVEARKILKDAAKAFRDDMQSGLF